MVNVNLQGRDSAKSSETGLSTTAIAEGANERARANPATDLQNIPILTELRLATAEQHIALEQSIDLPKALTTLVSYRLLLQSFFGLYSTLEPLVLTAVDLPCWLPDIPQRVRAPLLRADLDFLGAAIDPSNVCRNLLDVCGPAEAFGCLYVLEGSTLGGQFVARKVKESLGLDPQDGCSFFSGGGRDTRAMWRVFGDCLTAFAAEHPAMRPCIVQSAIETFRLFQRWFSTRSTNPRVVG